MLTFMFFLQGELPLVGNQAPDFEAEAVFDQEFITVTHHERPFGVISYVSDIAFCN